MFFPTVVSVFLGLVPTTFARSLHQSARQTTSTSCENTATSRSCWGDYDLDTDYYEVTPDTGVTREVWRFFSGIMSPLLTFNSIG
jgi:hypothetical protein